MVATREELAPADYADAVIEAYKKDVDQLCTMIGDVDLLGGAIGIGGYQELLPCSVELEIFGHRCKYLTLERLIQTKRAAGRPEDFETIAQMQALLEERRKQQ